MRLRSRILRWGSAAWLTASASAGCLNPLPDENPSSSRVIGPHPDEGSSPGPAAESPGIEPGSAPDLGVEPGGAGGDPADAGPDADSSEASTARVQSPPGPERVPEGGAPRDAGDLP